MPPVQREKGALVSVHRLEPVAEVSLPAEGDTVAWSDRGLEGLRRYYYRVAAVDASGNISEPAPVLGIRVTDSQPPAPPACRRSPTTLSSAPASIGRARLRRSPSVSPRSMSSS